MGLVLMSHYWPQDMLQFICRTDTNSSASSAEQLVPHPYLWSLALLFLPYSRRGRTVLRFPFEYGFTRQVPMNVMFVHLFIFPALSLG